MKFTAFFLIFIIFFTGCASKPEEQPTPVPEPAPAPPPIRPPQPARPDFSQRVLVNQEIADWIQQLDEGEDDIHRLIFYLDKSFSLEFDDQDNSPIVEIGHDGMLIVSARTQALPLQFNTMQQGKIKNFTPKNNVTFGINLEVESRSASLRFRKNAKDDFFELFSMEFDTGTYNLKSDAEFPKLYIYAKIDENIRNEKIQTADFLAVPVSALDNRNNFIKDTNILLHDTTENAGRINIEQINASQEKIESEKTDQEKTGNNIEHTAIEPEKKKNDTQAGEQEVTIKTEEHQIHDSSLAILASGSLTETAVFNYVKSLPGNPVLKDNEINQLIKIYMEEAEYEGVNHDIAFAQMLHITGTLRYGDVVRSNNFGGLSKTDTWNGSFPNLPTFRNNGMQEGVRAHIQHLKGYASPSLRRIQNVNPRWNLIEDIRGTIQTLDQLYEKWTIDHAAYKANIESILKSLYSFL